MAARAEVSEDPATAAAAAYVATETYFVTGDLATAYRALVAALDRADRPGTGSTPAVLASTGALHMRAAVVCARRGDAVTSADHFAAASYAAGPGSGRHLRGNRVRAGLAAHPELAVATELRDADAVVRAARWQPPPALPAERRSHYFIELGRAQFDLGRFGDARDAFAAARQIAPQHTRRHPQVLRISAALRQAGPGRRSVAAAAER